MAEPGKTSRGMDVFIALIGAAGAFLGGWASKDAEQKKDESNIDTASYRNQYIIMSEKYDSILIEHDLATKQSQQYALALRKCQDALKIPMPSKGESRLPSRAVKNLLIEPTSGLNGRRVDGEVVFEFRVSTDDQEETASLNMQQTSIVGDDGNTYRATYAEIGGKSTADNSSGYTSMQGTLYRSAPLKATYKFQLPPTVTRATALSIDVDGKRVLYSDVIIRWQ